MQLSSLRMCYWILILTLLIASGCSCQPKQGPDEQAGFAASPIQLLTLKGTVIRKPWAKSYESWNAGGSEYYVLSLQDSQLPPGMRTAKEGVILRETAYVSKDDMARFVGQLVLCEGKFVEAKSISEDDYYRSQNPSANKDPVTGKLILPKRGGGFEVHAISRIDPVPKP